MGWKLWAKVGILLALAPQAGAAADERWVAYPGAEGPGKGKHVVLVCGDEEYRSEEALPMLGKLLSVRHGFRCTVLFSQDEQGVIDPGRQDHIPGLEALEKADLLVLFTRFRRLPDDQMRHLVGYVESGRPILALRTATHAFAYPANSQSPHARWSWDSKSWPGGFGKQVLGETWVAHHGAHGSESTRGVVPEVRKEHPILRGVRDVWGPTDVYAIGKLPEDALVLLEGAVLAGMEPSSRPVEGARNDPRMPIAWLRERPLDHGAKQRIFVSTIGAASDLANEDLRRLLVNAAYWCTGLEQRIPARAAAEPVGAFEPSAFGFGGHRKGVKPAEHALPRKE